MREGTDVSDIHVLFLDIPSVLSISHNRQDFPEIKEGTLATLLHRVCNFNHNMGVDYT